MKVTTLICDFCHKPIKEMSKHDYHYEIPAKLIGGRTQNVILHKHKVCPKSVE